MSVLQQSSLVLLTRKVKAKVCQGERGNQLESSFLIQRMVQKIPEIPIPAKLTFTSTNTQELSLVKGQLM
jgi:hypothetical protein